MNIELTRHEISVILRALDKEPRNEVEPLIKKIVEQEADEILRKGFIESE